MKKIFLSLALLLTIQCCFAQVAYYKGEWTMIDRHDLFTGIFKISMNAAGKVKAEIVWTYLAIDSTSKDYMDMYQNKKGKSGIEYAEGNFSSATNDLYFEGIKKDDPFIILGVEKYHLKLAANKQAIYGSTETEGTNKGLLYAVKLNYTAGKKEFRGAKTKIKK
jgi:hypothetical protein